MKISQILKNVKILILHYNKNVLQIQECEAPRLEGRGLQGSKPVNPLKISYWTGSTPVRSPGPTPVKSAALLFYEKLNGAGPS